MAPFASTPQSSVKDVKLVRNGALALHNIAAYGELQLAQRLWKAAHDLDADILGYYGTSNSSTRIDNSTGTLQIHFAELDNLAGFQRSFF